MSWMSWMSACSGAGGSTEVFLYRQALRRGTSLFGKKKFIARHLLAALFDWLERRGTFGKFPRGVESDGKRGACQTRTRAVFASEVLWVYFFGQRMGNDTAKYSQIYIMVRDHTNLLTPRCFISRFLGSWNLRWNFNKIRKLYCILPVCLSLNVRFQKKKVPPPLLLLFFFSDKEETLPFKKHRPQGDFCFGKG
ncbi:hypothetical protein DFS34DRAFT_206865 [Phlyctochytrium arcticum]|nr:hypothetical protein DFS34DRAFT_206865 [Phlyctochytrium arcticum]